MEYHFNPQEQTAALVAWIQEEMHKIGAQKAVIGLSGGKDSSVVAALMTKALGHEQVFGLLMPNGYQEDIDYAYGIARHLHIRYATLDLCGASKAYDAMIHAAMDAFGGTVSKQTTINLPPRLRMALLYAVAQSLDAVVINTSNLSEDWVGYATVYGDTAGAFSPLGRLTTDEVIAIGAELGVPEKFLTKAPTDGLTGKKDEDVLGFSYEILNRYLRLGEKPNTAILERIDKLNKASRFKFMPIPMYDPKLPLLAEDIAGIYS